MFLQHLFHNKDCISSSFSGMNPGDVHPGDGPNIWLWLRLARYVDTFQHPVPFVDWTKKL